MAEALRCPHCGVGLDADAPQGLCASCLLEEGMKDPGSGPWSREQLEPTSYAVGFAPPEAADLAPHFPQLEILELLGCGGMGAVYKARQVRLDRLVALKVLPPEASRDPSFAERFTREARALARLNHPHIVGVHDFGEHEGLFYFIMEYVDGANLRRLLADGPLSPALTLQIIPQVCDALQYAHEEGIVHRDIKPENILLDQKGRVKIADFGLAKLLGQAPMHTRLTASRQVMGTPHYMAPEQMERPLTVDHRADIYSVGVVFYEMLTGELPLGRFAPPSHKAHVDERLDAIIFRALENQAERRYQRVSELQRDVTGLGGGNAAPAPTAEPYLPRPGVLPTVPALSVAFRVLTFWGIHGILRLQEQGLDIEYVHHFPFTSRRVKEKTISFQEIKSIGLKKSWATWRVILAAHRLSTLEDLAVRELDRAALLVPRADRQAAKALVAEVQRRLSALTPRPAGQGTPAPAARPPASLKPRMLGAFFRSVLYYCVDSFQRRKPPTPPPTQFGEPRIPAASIEGQHPAPGNEKSVPRFERLRVVQQLLLLICMICFVFFLSCRGSGEKGHVSFEMGAPSPWWTMEASRRTVETPRPPDVPPGQPVAVVMSFSHSSHVHFLSSSVLLLIVGLAAFNGAWVIEKRLAAQAGKRPFQTGRWEWIVVLFLVIGLALAGVAAAMGPVLVQWLL